MPKVLVVAETKNGELKKPTLELLSLAKSMLQEPCVTRVGCPINTRSVKPGRWFLLIFTLPLASPEQPRSGSYLLKPEET